VRDSFKSFINILKAYGLNQQRLSKIKIENCKSETQIILTNQQEQGGHLIVTKNKITRGRSAKSRQLLFYIQNVSSFSTHAILALSTPI
jgi:hypothetical protein